MTWLWVMMKAVSWSRYVCVCCSCYCTIQYTVCVHCAYNGILTIVHVLGNFLFSVVFVMLLNFLCTFPQLWL